MRLLLVDGHYYLYRSYFAVRGLTNSQGEPTNAIYAFAKALRKMLADVQPTHGAVLWDAGLPEHRTQLQPQYKQQRDPMPEELAAQEPAVVELCPLLGLASLSVPNHEADDLIAAFVAQTPAPAEVIVATADKDILQLADDRVRIYSTAKADLAAFAPGSGFVLLGPREVEQKWGVAPRLIGDVLALTGDSSDNIPGVPGIGEKTAALLVREFGSVENLLANLDQVGRDSLREKLRQHETLIRTNQKMVRLQSQLDLPAPGAALALQPRPRELLSFFRRCEFRSLAEEVAREMTNPPARNHSQPTTAPSPPTHTDAPLQAVQGELF